MRKSRRLRWILGGFAVIILLFVADYILFPLQRYAVDNTGNIGRNGLWLRYTWYFGQWNENDLHQLTRRLRDEQIRYAYCHVRYITPDGSLRFHEASSAQRLVRALHREAPGVKVLAWIYAGSEDGTPTVPIGDPKIRQKMVREARWLVTTCGFDGIQWDYEVCRNNDRRFLALLKETKHALPKSFISVCTPLCLPSPISRYYGWSEDYFVQVAAHCDQLAVMAYDSGIYLPRGYAWLLKEQTIHVTHAAGTSSSCRVIIGVPTYDEGGPSHHAHAENLRTALLGVNAACADQRLPRRVFDGVAIFADYTTSVREWHEYNDLWLRQTRH